MKSKTIHLYCERIPYLKDKPEPHQLWSTTTTYINQSYPKIELTVLGRCKCGLTVYKICFNDSRIDRERFLIDKNKFDDLFGFAP